MISVVGILKRIARTVMKNRVDAYLKKNPVMAKAWEDAGWEIGHSENA
jgi:hypothetical protein